MIVCEDRMKAGGILLDIPDKIINDGGLTLEVDDGSRMIQRNRIIIHDNYGGFRKIGDRFGRAKPIGMNPCLRMHHFSLGMTIRSI